MDSPGSRCFIRYANGMGYNTTGHSLFEAAANAIVWAEETCKHFDTARRLPDDEVLRISVGVSSMVEYRVRVGSVREWLRRIVKN